MKNSPLLKTLAWIALAMIANHLPAQGMNRFGHFPKPDLASQASAFSPADRAIQIDGRQLSGNAAFRVPTGYVTLAADYENAPGIVRAYDATGALRWEQTYRQTVNFTFSPNRRYAVLHDMTQIHRIDLQNLSSKAIAGSNVFAVSDLGEVATYDEAASRVYFKGDSYPVNERVYSIHFYENQPLFVAHTQLLQIRGNQLQPAFTAPAGRIFDIAISGSTLQLSTKVEQPCAFVFQAFSTTDLLHFEAGTTTEHPLAHCLQQVKPASTSKILTNEAIRDPLNFYQDTVYQRVGNSYDEIQEYVVGAPYLHPGVDLIGDYLQDVHAVKGGVAKAIITISAQYHWRIAISNNNTPLRSQGYLYAHLDETTIAYAVGDAIIEGDIVGQLVDFPDFVHCHFARITAEGATWSGNWWTFDNPLRFMTNVFDIFPPVFETTYAGYLFAFRDAAGSYVSPTSLHDDVKVIAKIYDQINDFWHVDVDRLDYSLSPLSSPTTMLIDTFSFEYKTYNDNYFDNTYDQLVLNTIYSRDLNCYTSADFNVRDYYHIITNSDGNDTITSNDATQMFHTRDYPDGDYIFRVKATDPFDHVTIDSMIIHILNPALGLSDPSIDLQVTIFPNPSTTGLFTIAADHAADFEITDVLGRKVSLGKCGLGESTLDLTKQPDGLYWAHFKHGNRACVQRLVVMH